MDQVLPAGPRIVVGVDDSPASRWALAWAVAEARLRGVPLLAVHVSRVPPVAPETPAYDHGALADEEARSLELIGSLFDDIAGGTPGDLQVVGVTRLGEPWHHLVELARPGDLLVLGRGARRRLSRLLLASTRRCCTRYTRTTVVIVPQAAAPDPHRPAERPRSHHRWLRRQRRAHHLGHE
ncbi:universal stress protein [Nonomuraea sp. NPDC003707]